MDIAKLTRIQNNIREVETQREKFSSGTPRRNDWERELQRLRNIEYKILSEGNQNDSCDSTSD